MSYQLRSTTRGKEVAGNPNDDSRHAPLMITHAAPPSPRTSPLEELHEGSAPVITSTFAESSHHGVEETAILTGERASQEQLPRQEAPRQEAPRQDPPLRQELPPRQEALRQELPPQEVRQELPPQPELPPPPPRGEYRGLPQMANPGLALTPAMMSALEALLEWRETLRVNEPPRAHAGGIAPQRDEPEAIHNAPADQPRYVAHRPEPNVERAVAMPNVVTLEQIEQLIDARMRQGGTRIMPALRDRASHPLHPDLARVVVPPGIVPRAIPDYVGKGDPVQHVQRHESSLLGKTADGDHHALTFPATLESSASAWFYGLPKGSITS